MYFSVGIDVLDVIVDKCVEVCRVIEILVLGVMFES